MTPPARDQTTTLGASGTGCKLNPDNVNGDRGASHDSENRGGDKGRRIVECVESTRKATFANRCYSEALLRLCCRACRTKQRVRVAEKSDWCGLKTWSAQGCQSATTIAAPATTRGPSLKAGTRRKTTGTRRSAPAPAN